MISVNYLYRSCALFMAFLMFFTSLGVSLDVHYCQGQLKSFNFSGKAKSCYQLIDAQSKQECSDDRYKKESKKTDTCSIQKENCCHSQLLQLLFDQNQNVHSGLSISDLQLDHFIVAFMTTLLGEKDADTLETRSASYKPPLVPRDIYVLLERFLL